MQGTEVTKQNGEDRELQKSCVQGNKQNKKQLKTDRKPLCQNTRIYISVGESGNE